MLRLVPDLFIRYNVLIQNRNRVQTKAWEMIGGTAMLGAYMK